METNPPSLNALASRKTVGALLLRLIRTSALLTVSVWGLAGFMTFQKFAFNDPFAFAKAQQFWHISGRETPPAAEKAWLLATLEPMRAKYDPRNPDYWARHEYFLPAPFSLNFADSIYFLFTAALIVLGVWKKRLNAYEWVTALFLLLIPYVTRGHENGMACFGRFSAAVLPAYFVMGWLLHRMGPTLSAAVLAISAFFLGLYSALFAAGYLFI